MAEQGGAGGVPAHEGHGSRRAGRPYTPHADEETAAADTDEASRLGRPVLLPGPASGRRRWVGPAGRSRATGKKRGGNDE